MEASAPSWKPDFLGTWNPFWIFRSEERTRKKKKEEWVPHLISSCFQIHTMKIPESPVMFHLQRRTSYIIKGFFLVVQEVKYKSQGTFWSQRPCNLLSPRGPSVALARHSAGRNDQVLRNGWSGWILVELNIFRLLYCFHNETLAWSDGEIDTSPL